MPGEKKKRWNRRAYLDDFQKTATGEYAYTGILHYYQDEGMPRRKALTILWALTAVMALTVLTAGCVPAAGMQSTAYVVLPYAGALLSTASVVWLMCRLSAGGDPLRDYVYRATVRQFAPRSILTIVFAACALLGDVVYLILHGVDDRLAGTVVFLTCIALLLGAALAWKSVTKKLMWAN